MSCEISGGRKIGCKEGAAGLLAVYFINSGVELTYTSSKVSDIQIAGGGAATVYKYELDNVGNSFTETLESNRDNGTFYNMQTLTLALQTLLDTDFEEIETLAKGRPLAVIQYRNGKARLAGATRGLDTSGSNESGGDLGDFQGYNLELTAKENNYAPLLEGATLEDPFAGLTTPPTVVTDPAP